MQERDILRIINSLVEKVNALAIALNTNEYNEESEDEYNEQLNKLLELEEQYPEFISENSPTKRGGGRINSEIHVRPHVNKVPRPHVVLDDEEVLAYIGAVDKAYNAQREATVHTLPKLRLS